MGKYVEKYRGPEICYRTFMTLKGDFVTRHGCSLFQIEKIFWDCPLSASEQLILLCNCTLKKKGTKKPIFCQR